MTAVSTEGQKRVVATRIYKTHGGTDVTATIYEPVMTRPDEWECPFRISGLPKEIDDCSHGVDGMQALHIAFEGLRFHLEASGEVLTFFDGEAGDLGLPRSIPSSFGVEVEKHLTAMLNDEVSRLVAAKAKSRGDRAP
jgi:hypothetical protein